MAATVCWSTQVIQTRSLKGAVLQGWLGFFFSLLCSSERWDASCMWWLETVMSLIVSLHRKGWNSPLAARKGVGENFQFQSVLWSLLYLRWYLVIQSFGLTRYTATVKLCSELNGVVDCRYSLWVCCFFFGGGGGTDGENDYAEINWYFPQAAVRASVPRETFLSAVLRRWLNWKKTTVTILSPHACRAEPTDVKSLHLCKLSPSSA